MKTFADRVLSFNRQLSFTGALPKGIRVMNPFQDNPSIDAITKQFYSKFYNDNKPRHLILGINPGRHGAGVTGVPFTDTKRLRDVCGINTDFESHEPSSVFVYEVIKAYGGAKKFYSQFYINSVCPLGFTKKGSNGKETNYNYYDSPELTKAAYGFIVKSIEQQLSFGIERDVCFCLGTGENADFLNDLNNEFDFFGRIVPLEHPRYIMQYKAKKKEWYVDKYVARLRGR